jgi:hypothetical protein
MSGLITRRKLIKSGIAAAARRCGSRYRSAIGNRYGLIPRIGEASRRR